MQYKILYIDDEPDNLLAFKAVFRRFYSIETALGAKEALQILMSDDIDLIISDHRMPNITGVEFFEQTKDSYPDVMRIILTGYSDVQAIIDAINKGKVYHYVTKPWKMEELKMILDHALETYSLKNKNRELERERNELIIRAIQQEKSQVESQYEALRNQVNPHFLFNSLNTLSSLIATDSSKAMLFTKQFSKVYRTILEWGNEPIISLREELELVESYLFLHQMRFGENLKVSFEISENRKNDSLPPFALQLLVENAIKHNIISDEKPLFIKISIENDKLVVKNNLQKRGSIDESTGIGLKNLNARYSYISKKNIEIEDENAAFVVKIPLIFES